MATASTEKRPTMLCWVDLVTPDKVDPTSPDKLIDIMSFDHIPVVDEEFTLEEHDGDRRMKVVRVRTVATVVEV